MKREEDVLHHIFLLRRLADDERHEVPDSRQYLLKEKLVRIGVPILGCDHPAAQTLLGAVFHASSSSVRACRLDGYAGLLSALRNGRRRCYVQAGRGKIHLARGLSAWDAVVGTVQKPASVFR